MYSLIYYGNESSPNSHYEKFILTGEVKCIDDEIPFELPKGWEWCRLGEVALVTGGYAFSSESLKSPQGIRVIRISDFNEQGWVNKSIVRYDGEDIASQYEIHINDLLLAMTGGTVGKSFFVQEVPEKMYLNQRVAIIRSTSLLPEYINIHLKSLFIIDLINSIKNSTNDNISMRDITSFPFPLPPLAEQQRIVAKIEELMPLVELYGKAQSKLEVLNTNIREQLKKSILKYAIEGKLVPQCEEDGTAEDLLQEIQVEKQRLYAEGKLKKKDLTHSTIFRGEDNKYYEQIGKEVICIDEEIPFEIPVSWRWVRVKDVVKINPKNEYSDNTIAAFIPMEKIEATFLSKFSYTKVQWGGIKSSFTHFADGDVAFAKITPCFQNRKSIVLQNLPNGIGAGTTELKVLRPYRETIQSSFLMYFLETPYFVENANFKGTANQQRILVGYLENKLLALPPLNEQRKISDAITALLHLLD